MNVWLVIGITYAVVAIGTMIFLNIIAPPRGPLTNEMAEDEARNSVIGLFWLLALTVVICLVLFALLEHAWLRRKSKRKKVLA
jgi:ABC-type dipeptide/oligopeptide/nickel transport system permease subunit